GFGSVEGIVAVSFKERRDDRITQAAGGSWAAAGAEPGRVGCARRRAALGRRWHAKPERLPGRCSTALQRVHSRPQQGRLVSVQEQAPALVGLPDCDQWRERQGDLTQGTWTASRPAPSPPSLSSLASG